MTCAVYILLHTSDINNIKHNYKLISKHVDKHFLISFVDYTPTDMIFEQIFIKLIETNNELLFGLTILKNINNTCKFLYCKNYKKVVITTSSIVLNETTSTNLMLMISSLSDDNISFYDESNKLSEHIHIAKIYPLLSNFSYYDCSESDLIDRVKSFEKNFYYQIFWDAKNKQLLTNYVSS